MKQKLFLLVLTYFLLIIVSIGINACGGKKVKLCELSFSAYHYNNELNLRNEIVFQINGEWNGPACAFTENNFKLVKRAYAWQKCVNYENSLLTSSFQLFMSDPLIYQNDTIAGNTDLLLLPYIKDHMELSLKDDCDDLEYEIVFPDTLVNHMIFPVDKYLVTFKCQTNDGIHFMREDTLHIAQ